MRFSDLFISQNPGEFSESDDIALLANTPAQSESLLHTLEQAAGDIGLHVNADKTEFMCFNKRGDISALNCGSLKLGWILVCAWLNSISCTIPS